MTYCLLKSLFSVRIRCSVFAVAAMVSSSASLHAQKRSETESEGRYKSLETLARGMFYLENLYVDAEKVSQDKLVSLALKGIVEKLDPHTVFMPHKAFQQMTIDTQGKFGGVGIIVSHEQGRLLVVSPIEGTPAHHAGVQAGDEILEINGREIGSSRSNEAVDQMRGAPGTKLKLKIKRKDVKEPLEFSLVREVIKVKSVRTKELTSSVMYARVASFQENTATELEESIKSKQDQLNGIILDLRDNPGGLLDQAVRISDLFIDSGLIVSTVGRDPQRVEREFAHKRDTLDRIPMVILINGGSASASEIVAGALQDHERAVVMGTTSFGKGSVQTLVSLPDGSGLKLTVARYFTPKDRSIQAKGIEPDVYVPKDFPESPSAKENGGKIRSEADLEGHIAGKDLSNLAQQHGTKSLIQKWPEAMQKDYQLISAFNYLQSFQKLNPNKKSNRKL